MKKSKTKNFRIIIKIQKSLIQKQYPSIKKQTNIQLQIKNFYKNNSIIFIISNFNKIFKNKILKQKSNCFDYEVHLFIIEKYIQK